MSKHALMYSDVSGANVKGQWKPCVQLSAVAADGWLEEAVSEEAQSAAVTTVVQP